MIAGLPRPPNESDGGQGSATTRREGGAPARRPRV